MRRHFVEARYRLPMRRMVWLGCFWMWVLGAMMSLVWLLAPAVDDMDLALSGGVMLLSLLCMGLAKTRKWAWAVSCFVWGNWLLSLLWAWHTGGLYGPAVMAFPAWLVVAVWVQGTRAALAMLGMSTLVVAALWWLAPQIGMPAAALSATEHLLALIHVVGMMMLVLIICLQARASLGRRVQKSMETLAALEASQNELRKFYRAVEQNPESIVITDPQLKVVYVNEAFLSRSGYAREQVLGQSTELVSTMGMDRSHRQRALKQLATGTLWRGEMTNRTSKGEALRESVLVTPIRTPQGEVVNYVELKRDLSERVLAERRIHDMVYLDPLTGLPNRHSLTLHLRELNLARQDACHGLLLLDVDRFSVFNDVHGMQHSDELVQAMGARLVEALPDDAWIARIAAAEFAIVFDSLHKHAQGVEEQLQQ